MPPLTKLSTILRQRDTSPAVAQLKIPFTRSKSLNLYPTANRAPRATLGPPCRFPDRHFGQFLKKSRIFGFFLSRFARQSRLVGGGQLARDGNKPRFSETQRGQPSGPIPRSGKEWSGGHGFQAVSSLHLWTYSSPPSWPFSFRSCQVAICQRSSHGGAGREGVGCSQPDISSKEVPPCVQSNETGPKSPPLPSSLS
jgi:hypothetical protein